MLMKVKELSIALEMMSPVELAVGKRNEADKEEEEEEEEEEEDDDDEKEEEKEEDNNHL